jgi:hypothetical protein
MGTPFNGYRDLRGRRYRNSFGIPIKTLGAVDRWDRSACNVRAFAHRHLEQVSGVVPPDISPDDYSGGARRWTVGCAPEQRRQQGLLRSKISFHVWENLMIQLIAIDSGRITGHSEGIGLKD